MAPPSWDIDDQALAGYVPGIGLSPDDAGRDPSSEWGTIKQIGIWWEANI